MSALGPEAMGTAAKVWHRCRCAKTDGGAPMAFGLITPPYGLVLLMASKFVGVSFGKALRAALPIYVVFLVTICFTIYFPKVVLWLPKQVIPESVGCFKSPAGTGYICPN